MSVPVAATAAGDPSFRTYVRPGFDAGSFMLDTLDGWKGYAFAVVDEAGVLLLFSRQMQELTGYTADEAIEAGFFPLLFPVNRNRRLVLRAIAGFLRGAERNHLFHWTIRRRDGAPRTVWSNSVAFSVAAGRRAMFMSWRDVTEYPGALGYDRATQRGFQELVESAPDIIMRFRTSDRRCVYINRAVARLTGLEPKAFYQDAGLWRRLIAVPDRPRFDEAFEAASRGATTELDCCLCVADRTVHLTQKLYPIEDDAGSVFAVEGIGRDLSERRELEQRLSGLLRDKDAANAALEGRMREIETANDKLRSLDRFKSQILANVSHELRTPLVTLCGYTELILSAALGAVDSKQKQALQVMKRSGRRLSALIENMLEYAKIQEGRVAVRRERFDLRRCAAEVAKEMADRLTERGVRFGLSLPRHAVPILGDRVHILLLIRNLLGNADKFTNDGGRIDLTVRGVGGLAHLAVQDNGIGIHPEDQPHIFERFYQADGSPTRRHAGAGLGLAIVREVVDMHGGTIVVDSAPGRGSRFEILLPRAAGARRSTPRRRRAGGAKIGLKTGAGPC